jgi:hypothetical protein
MIFDKFQKKTELEKEAKELETEEAAVPSEIQGDSEDYR